MIYSNCSLKKVTKAVIYYYKMFWMLFSRDSYWAEENNNWTIIACPYKSRYIYSVCVNISIKHSVFSLILQ